MILKQSIKARLVLYISAFLVLVFSIGTLAAVSLLRVDARVQDATGRWLTGGTLLASLSRVVAEVRASETGCQSGIPASAPDHGSDAVAAVAEAVARYRALAGSGNADLRGFEADWSAYLAERDPAVACVPGSPAASRRDAAYRSVSASIERLVAGNDAAVRAEGDVVRQNASSALTTIWTLLGLSVALAGAVLVLAWHGILKPLETIATAFSSLADGDRRIALPGISRVDEIGSLAKAFHAFHATMAALEKAHGETRRAQRKAQELARRDPLTDMPNRRAFTAELEAAVARTGTEGRRAAVLLVDLDRFKPVNDIHGHALGDLVLCEVARRIGAALGAGASAARLGGDEFAVLLDLDASAADDVPASVARRLLQSIRRPMVTGGATLEIGSSIGVAICPDHGGSGDLLLRAADLAMYRAKNEGRNRFRVFERGMDEEIRSRVALEADLRAAITSLAIEPHFQPIVDLADGRICGFEVLARWTHPVRGRISPDVFIPCAEQLGLIAPLTFQVLRRACRDLRACPPDLRLSLNVSPLQLRDPLLPVQILGILAEEGFAASRLEVEVTESALVSDLDTAKRILSTLRGFGVTVALDDFGTGYSSLFHLRELRFDTLKIDRSFVQSMDSNHESEKIVDAVLGLARSLDMPTVAEGIENADVLARLAERGCRFGQGYHLGRPVPADALPALFAQEQRTAA